MRRTHWSVHDHWTSSRPDIDGNADIYATVFAPSNYRAHRRCKGTSPPTAQDTPYLPSFTQQQCGRSRKRDNFSVHRPPLDRGKETRLSGHRLEPPGDRRRFLHGREGVGTQRLYPPSPVPGSVLRTAVHARHGRRSFSRLLSHA